MGLPWTAILSWTKARLWQWRANFTLAVANIQNSQLQSLLLQTLPGCIGERTTAAHPLTKMLASWMSTVAALCAVVSLRALRARQMVVFRWQYLHTLSWEVGEPWFLFELPWFLFTALKIGFGGGVSIVIDHPLGSESLFPGPFYDVLAFQVMLLPSNWNNQTEMATLFQPRFSRGKNSHSGHLTRFGKSWDVNISQSSGFAMLFGSFLDHHCIQLQDPQAELISARPKLFQAAWQLFLRKRRHPHWILEIPRG